MPSSHLNSERYIFERSPSRTLDDHIVLSLKLTMSHPDDHFHYGCFPRPARRNSPATGNNNPNNNQGSIRRGFFGLGTSGRAVLPPLFRSSRSPGVYVLTIDIPQPDSTSTRYSTRYVCSKSVRSTRLNARTSIIIRSFSMAK